MHMIEIQARQSNKNIFDVLRNKSTESFESIIEKVIFTGSDHVMVHQIKNSTKTYKNLFVIPTRNLARTLKKSCLDKRESDYQVYINSIFVDFKRVIDYYKFFYKILNIDFQEFLSDKIKEFLDHHNYWMSPTKFSDPYNIPNYNFSNQIQSCNEMLFGNDAEHWRKLSMTNLVKAAWIELIEAEAKAKRELNKFLKTISMVE